MQPCVHLLREGGALLHSPRFGFGHNAAASSWSSGAAGRLLMGDEVRATGGLDSAHDRRPPRRSPWGRRSPYGSCAYRDGPPARAAATYAALDLGTNNCRLLVARPTGDSFRVIDAFSRIIRLGEGISASGRISDAGDRARGRGARHLPRQDDEPRRHPRAADRDRGLPRAANGGDFRARVARARSGSISRSSTARPRPSSPPPAARR